MNVAQIAASDIYVPKLTLEFAFQSISDTFRFAAILAAILIIMSAFFTANLTFFNR